MALPAQQTDSIQVRLPTIPKSRPSPRYFDRDFLFVTELAI